MSSQSKVTTIADAKTLSVWPQIEAELKEVVDIFRQSYPKASVVLVEEDSFWMITLNGRETMRIELTNLQAHINQL